MEYTEDQLTEWFDIATKKPSVIGVYQVTENNYDGCWYSFWDGFCFGYFVLQASNPKAKRRDTICVVQSWRGLSSEPQKPKKRANKRKTMYVVMQHQEGFKSYPLASFEDKKIADKRALWFKKNITFAYHPATYSVETVRFRVD